MKSSLHRILLAVSAVGFALVPLFSRAAPLAVTVGGRSYTVEIAGGTVTVARLPGGSVATLTPGQTVAPDPEIATAAWTGVVLAAESRGAGSTEPAALAVAATTLRSLAPDGLQPALAGLVTAAPAKLAPLLTAAIASAGENPPEPTLVALASAAAQAATTARPADAAANVATAILAAAAALPRGTGATAVDSDAAVRLALAVVRSVSANILVSQNPPQAGQPASVSQKDIQQLIALGNAGYTALLSTLPEPVMLGLRPDYLAGFKEGALASLAAYGVPPTTALEGLVGRMAANIDLRRTASAASATAPGPDNSNPTAGTTAQPVTNPPSTSPPRPIAPAVDPALNASSSGGG